jgi:murein DD-endopeptidase MepM/ murein hydrolase activator NlpD
VISLTSSSFNLAGNEKGDEKSERKDTVRAIVLYGNSFLIKPSVELSDELIKEYVDSLFNMPVRPEELISQINLYLSIKEKSDNDIILMIDSLFELDEVPFALINQINYYIATRDYNPDEMDVRIAITAFYDTSVYPANCFYDSWDTQVTHPYADDLWKEDDTTLVLVIQDSVNYCNYVSPYKGIVTSHYGWRDGRLHKGIDIGLRQGDPVVSAFDGMVRVARYHGGYGNVVVVRHYNGLETLYAHLYKIKVKPGQVVNAGQLIGLGGNTGRSTGSHLHFEVRFKGKPVDPKHLMCFNEHKLHSEAFVFAKSKLSYTAYPEGTEFHTVAKGEYISLIADRYGISIKELCELNGISRKTVLKVGQKLRVS